MHADMHLEILTEDSSTAALMTVLLPKLIGDQGATHTWRLHDYSGIGRLPKNILPGRNPKKRLLLDSLPGALAAYGKTSGTDHVVVILDADDRNCAELLNELKAVVANCNPAPTTLFRLAIEETEAWYFGDQQAVMAAYPKAKKVELKKYVQDSVCGTWERLADALVSGGSSAIKKQGWRTAGQLKHEWANKIGSHMDPDRNSSPSFAKLRDGLRRITQPATGVNP